MSDINERIVNWVKPINMKIRNIEVRDCFKERNTPLIIEGDLSGYIPSAKRILKGENHDESQRD